MQEADIRRITVQNQPHANSLQGPISKISNTKQVAQALGLEFKPQYRGVGGEGKRERKRRKGSSLALPGARPGLI
jgi:hypothetical protein